MPCRVLIKSNLRNSKGALHPGIRSGVVAAIMPISHVWNAAEQAPNFCSFELECSEKEAAVLLSTDADSGANKYLYDFDRMPKAARAHVIENKNSPVGNSKALRWSEMQRSFDSGAGEPSIPSLDAKTLPARARGKGAHFNTEMVSKKGTKIPDSAVLDIIGAHLRG